MMDRNLSAAGCSSIVRDDCEMGSDPAWMPSEALPHQVALAAFVRRYLRPKPLGIALTSVQICPAVRYFLQQLAAKLYFGARKFLSAHSFVKAF